MELISYYGTGLSGENNPCSVTCSFAPDIWVHLGGTNYSESHIQKIQACISSITPVTFKEKMGFHADGLFSKTNYGKISEDKKTFSWYCTADVNPIREQLNEEGFEYFVLAIRV